MHKIGILGFGTVGQGVYRIWERSEALQKEAAIGKILVRNLEKARATGVPAELFTTNPADIFEDPTIDIIVEVTGNVDPMTDLLLGAFEAGKHVVTANKALVSNSFEELSREAERFGVHFLYEASVAGGVPILKNLNDITRTNHISQIDGILNGTCNFILTEMGKKGEPYEDALHDAQQKGFAEADPTADVSGQDTMRKLRILSSLAFKGSVKEEDIPMQGIDNLGPQDLKAIAEMGRTVKLLGISTRDGDRFTARVFPAALEEHDARAQVLEAGNVVHLTADVVGWLQFMGPGAGMFPTANAIWADLLDIFENRRDLENPLGEQILKNANDDCRDRYYVRVDDISLVRTLGPLGLTPVEGWKGAFLTEPVQKKSWDQITTPIKDSIHWVIWAE